MDVFAHAFMQRALIAGSISGLLLGALGVFSMSRRMTFVGDSIAHASLAAIAMALLLGVAPLPFALLASLVFAVLIHVMAKKTTLSHDSVLGIIFVGGMALGIVLLQFYKGYVNELMNILFGNFLAIRTLDVAVMLGVGVVLLGIIALLWRSFTFSTIDPDGAALHGIRTDRMDLILTIIIALGVTMSIKVVGIVLVSGLLVLPSATSKLLATSFRGWQIGATVLGLLMVWIGLITSYYADLPSGAVIVLVGVAMFSVAAVVRQFLR